MPKWSLFVGMRAEPKIQYLIYPRFKKLHLSKSSTDFDQVALVLFAQTMRMLGTRVLRQCLLQCMARLCLQLRCGEQGRWGKWGDYSCLAVSKIGGCFTDDVFTWYMYTYIMCRYTFLLSVFFFGEIFIHPVACEDEEDTTPIQAKRVFFIYFFSGWTLMATAGLWASS